MLVTTVTGRLPAAAVKGPVLAHEHLVLDLATASSPHAVLRPDRHAACVTGELSGLRRSHGLALVVEMTCRGMGQDPGALVALSQEAGVPVVAATGWYYGGFLPPEVRETDADRLAGILIRDIREGIGATGVRPGVIGEVGSSGQRPGPAERRVLEAAARAGVATGLSVATHAHHGAGGIAQLEILTGAGLPARRNPLRFLTGACASRSQVTPGPRWLTRRKPDQPFR